MSMKIGLRHDLTPLDQPNLAEQASRRLRWSRICFRDLQQRYLRFPDVTILLQWLSSRSVGAAAATGSLKSEQSPARMSGVPPACCNALACEIQSPLASSEAFPRRDSKRPIPGGIG